MQKPVAMACAQAMALGAQLALEAESGDANGVATHLPPHPTQVH